MVSNKKIHIVKKDDQENDIQYYLQFSTKQRLELVEELRQRYIKLFYATQPGFQRVYRFIRKIGNPSELGQYSQIHCEALDAQYLP